MKLDPLKKLMATLATETTQFQLDDILLKPDFLQWERDSLTSTVSMLVALQRKCGSNTEFLDRLEGLLEGIQENQKLTNAVRNFREQNVDVDALGASCRLPNGAFMHKPTGPQKRAFSSAMLQISRRLSSKDFHILRALSPIPDGRKEGLNTGLKLFDALKTHGCISENDVELLDDFFTHLSLIVPQTVLKDYQEKYPSQYYDPSPSAPIQHSFPTGHMTESHTFPSLPGQHPIQEVNPPSSLYHRPGHRDPTYPHQSNSPPIVAHPNTDTHSSHPASHMAGQATCNPPASQVNISDTRSGRELISPPVQPESPTERESRPPPQNPTYKLFLRQMSPGTPVSTPVSTPAALPSAPSQPITTSSTAMLSPPLTQPASSSPSHPTLPPSRASTTVSAASSSSSASYDHRSESAFCAEPQSCQSTGDRSHFVSLPTPHTQASVASGGPYSPRTASSSYGWGKECQSLPVQVASRDRLLGKRSRQMDEVPRSEPTKRAMYQEVNCSPQRSVFTQGDIRCGVGSHQDENLPSINGAVLQHGQKQYEQHACQPGSSPVCHRSSATQPRSTPTQPRSSTTQPGSPPTQPGSSPTQPRSSNCGTSEATHQEDTDHDPYHPLTYSSSPPNISKGSSLVSGISGSPLGTNILEGSSHGDLYPNTPTSQFVTHNGSYRSSPFNPSHSEHSVSSYELSTRSLVNRQLFRQSHGMSASQAGSSSFASIPEDNEDQEINERNNDSSESEPRRRAREEISTSSGSSSSSENEDEEPSKVKRARTEEHKKSGIGGFFTSALQSLPIINRLYQKTPREDQSNSDSSESFVDALED